MANVTNIGTQRVQEVPFSQLRTPGCSSTQWTLLNSYDNVNDPASLFGYDV